MRAQARKNGIKSAKKCGFLGEKKRFSPFATGAYL
jgi:hypothetical protein